MRTLMVSWTAEGEGALSLLTKRLKLTQLWPNPKHSPTDLMVVEGCHVAEDCTINQLRPC